MGRISPKFVHSGKARDEMKPAKKISAQFKFVARPMVYSSPLMPLLIIRTRTTCWNPRNFIFFHPSSPRRRRPTGGGVAQAREPRSRQPPPRSTALLSGGGRSISTHTHSRPSLHFNPSIANQQQGMSAAAAAPAVMLSNMSELVMMRRQELQHHGRKQHTRVVKK